MAEQDIKTRPFAFRGSLVLNQRSLRSAFETVNDEKLRQLEKPFRAPDLINLCLLLESIAFSNELYVDGTLPPSDLAVLEYEILRAEKEAGRKIKVQQIRSDATHLTLLFRESAETAALSIQDALHNLDRQPDDPIAAEVNEFQSMIVDNAREPHRVRSERAAAIADAASRGVDSFRGSKCAAGILIAEAEDMDLLEVVAFHLRSVASDRARKIVAVLINRFRINYVNSLASTKKAAYLADITIEDLKSAQVVLFWRYLAKKLAERHSIHLTPETRSAFDQKLAATPLGFAILLNTQGHHPHDLICEAFDIRSRRFAKQAAHATVQDRFMHEMDVDAFGDFQDYLYKSKWIELHNHAEREKLSICWWRQMKLPAALGAGIGGFVGALSHNLALTVGLAHLGGELLGEAFESATEKASHAGRIHVDQYRKLDGYLKLATDNDRLGRNLSEQVLRLFGRPLEL